MYFRKEIGKWGENLACQYLQKNNLRYGNPSDAVTRLKQKHMKQTAKYYIFKNDLDFQKIRFDMIEVFIQSKKAKVNHIEQIF